jgi:hypothetical protein
MPIDCQATHEREHPARCIIPDVTCRRATASRHRLSRDGATNGRQRQVKADEPGCANTRKKLLPIRRRSDQRADARLDLSGREQELGVGSFVLALHDLLTPQPHYCSGGQDQGVVDVLALLRDRLDNSPTTLSGSALGGGADAARPGPAWRRFGPGGCL